MYKTKLEQYIKTHGIKQTWLANKINLTVKNLNDIVKGKVKLKADTATSIATVLNIKIEEII